MLRQKQPLPSFSYLTDASYEAMDFVRQLREQGEACYFTMDAGPNVKVPCLEEDLEHLSELLGQRYRLIVSKTKDLSQDGLLLKLAENSIGQANMLF